MLGAAQSDALGAEAADIRPASLRVVGVWRARPACGNSSAHSGMESRSPVISGSTSSTAPSTTEPGGAVDGDHVAFLDDDVGCPRRWPTSSRRRCAAPPRHRHRSAYTTGDDGSRCDILPPPSEVGMPSAAIVPARSSGIHVPVHEARTCGPPQPRPPASAAENHSFASARGGPFDAGDNCRRRGPFLSNCRCNS